MIRIPKILLSTLLTSVFAVFSTGCNDSKGVDEPLPSQPYLTLKNELPTFGSPGGTASLSFSTNETWSITPEPPKGESGDWFEVSPLSGDAGKDIAVTVSVQPNEEYTGRSVTLILRSESLEKRIELTQLKKNAIIVGDNRREITSGEQPLMVKVQSNVTYGVEVKQGDGWISEVQKSRAGGLKEEEHNFTISANPLTEERTGIIVFKDNNSDLFDELTIVQAAWEDPDPERTALNSIYDAAGGDAWINKENWCSDKPLGEWYGVETDAEGNVTALRLPKNNLTGTVSWEIAKLTRLRHLDLSRNALGGNVSLEGGKVDNLNLYNLAELENIDLSHNDFVGQPSIDWYKLGQLKSLDFSSNRLKGVAIPIQWKPMFENGRVVDVILNNNKLYGDIPSVIQNHPQWGRLALQMIRQNYEGGGGVSYSKDILLPDFTFTDLRDGSQGTIRNVYSGNTLTMLLAWDPTQEDSKTFLETTVRRFHTLFGQQGFAVVAIIPEGDEYRMAAQAYLREHDTHYPVVTDCADAQGRRIVLPTEPYPSYFLVDKNGKVSNDMFTGQYCYESLSPEEPFLIDVIQRPFQHTETLGKIFKKTFGNSNYLSSDFTMDKKYETLQRATRGKGIDIILIGEAYTDVDIATGYYKQVMEFAKEAFFAIEPTKSYRDYFSIHMVYAVSRNAYIDKSGVSTALSVEPQNYDWFYTSTAIYNLRNFYDVVATQNYKPTIGVVINGSGGGVTTIDNNELRPNYAFTGYQDRRSFREDFIHEKVGHGLGWLGDEYTRSGASYQGVIPESEKKKIISAHNKDLFLNLSLTNDPKSVNWSHLIGHPRYPYVGVYEGGYYYAKGVWRSETQSLMDHQSDYYFNTICRELIVKRIMKLAGEDYTFEKFLAKDSDEGRRGSSMQTSRQTTEHLRRHQPPIIVDSPDQ